MNNAERYSFADFTHANYRRLLALAKNSYPFLTYDEFEPDGRFVIWRHDVDFSVQAALKLAHIEKEVGVKATYFVDFHSSFYNLLEHAASEDLRKIIGLGHQVGLHFDSRYAHVDTESSLVDHLGREKKLLEEIVGEKVRVFSFHWPSPFTMGCLGHEYAGMINVYSGYFRNRVGYCSDSNGYWRHQKLEDVLAARTDDRLQVLTHPAWWQESVMSPHERMELCISDRANNTRHVYREILETSGRPDIDW